MMKVALSSILGGLILFAWCAISWMYLPWHAKSLNNFSQEVEVTKVITAQAPASGVYMLPGVSNTQDDKDMSFEATVKGPVVFASIRLEDSPPMKKLMINQLLIQILAALIVTLMMKNVYGLSYWHRVRYVTLFGLFGGIVTYLPFWNWYGFSFAYVSAGIIDLVISWFLAGLVIAGLSKKD